MTKNFFNPGCKLTLSGKTYTVSTRAWSVQLELVEGEPGRFYSASSTQKVCRQCNARFTRKSMTDCPRCHVQLDPRIYLVDVMENAGRGKCDCESYTYNRRDDTGQNVICQNCKHCAAAMILNSFCIGAAEFEAQKHKSCQA